MGKERFIRQRGVILQRAIARVFMKEIHDPEWDSFISVTRVEVSKDWRCAKVFVSTIGGQEQQENAMLLIEKYRGWISACTAKKVSMRIFPKLSFHYDYELQKEVNLDLMLSQLGREHEGNQGND